MRIKIFRPSRPAPVCAFNAVYSFSAARNRALRARGFAAVSSAVGRSGLRVISRSAAAAPHPQTGNPGGQMHPRAPSANALFTIRSSSE